jgi:predicted transcriptional regulator
MENKPLELPLMAAMHLLIERKYTKPHIAALIGVSTLQVHYYATGKTKCPTPIICKAILDNFNILINIYKSIEELDSHLEIFKEQRRLNEDRLETTKG